MPKHAPKWAWYFLGAYFVLSSMVELMLTGMARLGIDGWKLATVSFILASITTLGYLKSVRPNISDE